MKKLVLGTDKVSVNIFNDEGGSNTPKIYRTIILKPNVINGINTLLLSSFLYTNTKYVIKYTYDLLEETITIPENCIIEFDGGSINNGTLVGDNTGLIIWKGTNSAIFEGTWQTLVEPSSSIDEKLNRKVDKVEGKQLSTEDFTTEHKDKLEHLTPTTEADVQNIPDNGICFYKRISFNNVASKSIQLTTPIILKEGSKLEITGNIGALTEGGYLSVFFKKRNNSYIEQRVSSVGPFNFEYLTKEDTELIGYGVISNGVDYTTTGECIFTVNLVPDFYDFRKKQWAFNQDVNDIIVSTLDFVDTSSVAKPGTSSEFKGFVVNKSYVAPARGTIKKLYIYSPTTNNTAKVYTCTKDLEFTFTIKNVYEYSSLKLGLNIIPVTIPVDAGDYLGIYIAEISNMLPYSATETNGWYWLIDAIDTDIVSNKKIVTGYLPNYSLSYGFAGVYNNDNIVTETIVVNRNQSDYNSIRDTLNSIVATEKHRYIVYVPNGEWFECDLQGKKYVEIIGQDKEKTIIYCDGTSDNITPADYSYNGKGNTAINELEQSFRHVFYLKNDCIVKNLTIKAEDCKYCVHMDNKNCGYVLFENCIFDSINCNHPVGIGVFGGQNLNILNCVFRSNFITTGLIIHNWNNQTKSTSVRIIDSLFDNCGFINVDELGSDQTDVWQLLNCYSNIGGFLTFMVDNDGNGNTYYINPTTQTKETNPQNVPYSIKLNCLGSNVISCQSAKFNYNNEDVIARPNFAKYLITDHYIKVPNNNYQIGSVVNYSLTEASNTTIGIVECIIDDYAYIAKDTVWLSQNDIQGNAQIGDLVYVDSQKVSVSTSDKKIGKILALSDGLFQIGLFPADAKQNELVSDDVVKINNESNGPHVKLFISNNKYVSRILDARDSNNWEHGGNNMLLTKGALEEHFASKDLIPVQASSANKLADKNFVNSSISTATANLANVAITGNYADLINKPDFADVATSGSYLDLTDKPEDSAIIEVTLTSEIDQFISVGTTDVTLAQFQQMLYNYKHNIFAKCNIDESDIYYKLQGYTSTDQTITAIFGLGLSGDVILIVWQEGEDAYVVYNKYFIQLLDNKVDKVSGKGLSTNDYTDADKTKLEGILAGAEVNVLADWNLTNSDADDYIKNKPTIPDISGKADKVANTTNGNLAGLDANGNLTDSGLAAGQVVASTSIRTIVTLTQAQYDALTTKDANTEYNIIESV